MFKDTRPLAVMAGAAFLVVTILVMAGSTERRGPHRAGFGGRPLEVPEGGWTHLEGVLSVFGGVRMGPEWLILDGRADRVHVLSEDGSLLRSFGRSGDGPGELKRAAALAVTGDTLWVLNLSGTRVDGFTGDGGFVKRIQPTAPCGAPFLDDVVATDEELVLAIRCFGLLGDKRSLTRVRVGDGTSITEVWPLAGDEGVSGDLTRLVVEGEAVLAGSMFRPCLEPLWTTSAPSTCLPPGDRVLMAPALHDSLQAAYDSRIPFLARKVAPYYPYYVDAVSTPRGIFFLQPEGENHAVLRYAGGEGAEVLRIPAGALPFLADDHLLLVQDAMDGVRVALAALPGEGPW